MACICGKLSISTCSRCQLRQYCSRACQVKDWKAHSRTCLTPEAISKKITSTIHDMAGCVQQFAQHNGNVIIAIISETVLNFITSDFHFVHLSQNSEQVSYETDSTEILIIVRLIDREQHVRIKKYDAFDTPNPGQDWTVLINDETH